MDGTTPIITKKKALIALTVFLVLMGVGTFLLLYQGPSQDIPDDSEPMLNFAAPNSKIAEIQVLVKGGGLSWEQYKKVYVALNEKLPEMEPDARYFYFVEGSLGAVASNRANEVNVVIEPSDYTHADPNEVFYEEDRSMITEREEMEIVDTILFTMRSEAGTEYDVEVYTAGDLETTKVKIEKK